MQYSGHLCVQSAWPSTHRTCVSMCNVWGTYLCVCVCVCVCMCVCVCVCDVFMCMHVWDLCRCMSVEHMYVCAV